jgi:hypothetical protein
LEDDGSLSDDEDGLDALLVEVARALARLLLGVLADEGDLGIFVFNEGSQLDEIEVVWHKQDSIAGTSFIDAVPNLLSEVAEPSGISMFKARHVW